MTIVTGQSQWYGSFKEGTGTLSTTTTDTLREAPYTFASRFEGAPGAIPEELLVTGHAGCYNHALANIAFKAGVTVESITTTAELTMGTTTKALTATATRWRASTSSSPPTCPASPTNSSPNSPSKHVPCARSRKFCAFPSP
ncbi:MAG: lipoyl-dependent peroxiredoxin [Mycobacterium sp.]|jgi:organic hydroperoxide reductase OsmC/OhrA|nr:lipoyl-dependent peroxiredoxin [Mycobacterium sp.]